MKREAFRELQTLVKEKQGQVLPEQIVDRAKPENNPLHDYFTWNDREAGRLRRLTEARRLIQLYNITIVKTPKLDGTRLYHVKIENPVKFVAFQTEDKVKSSQVVLEQTVRWLTKELDQWCRRAKPFEELEDLVSGVETLLAKHMKRSIRVYKNVGVT